ncbi:peptidoglycan hydrolase-like protein with peptidoglycan-binding domain [Agromyces hippuratus]|uniref:Peptidoglycan hydrolase-like protein with peptidoglycan-binding domain n=1 Tax=Agromyces hippuratus TaxID=286438 RepID=A0A852WVI3_9MICO|nr:peptidoglycan-binding protein [Agromyces hippuratus]NYG22342.1 peptidoglycan hydrolase-like protein with peptidoglycan-binding domain [Agromyces hippuratus]
MNTDRTRMPGLLATAMVSIVVAVALTGCAEGADSVDRAKAQVTAKEKAVASAQAEFDAASEAFCGASSDYISALDRYGDVLNDTAPTVGDVQVAGADLADPRDDAFDDAEAAVAAQQALVTARQELVEAQTALAVAEAGPTGTPSVVPPAPTSTPLAPAASVDRVEQAEAEFEDAQASVTAQTPLADASEQFNSAVVALEMAWLTLFADAGCLTDDQQVQAVTAVGAYTYALQQDLATAGYYTGTVDGVSGPMTVQAIEDLQEANGLPVTGTVDKATAAALQAELVALGGAAAQDSLASTAAVQQTLNLVGFWDGPVDGVWTDELTAALQAFQTELGVEPTGAVDAATIAAFEQAIAEMTAPDAEPSPSASPTSPPAG